MLLAGHPLLITGVSTTDSIAFHAAREAKEQGAEVILTAPDRARAFTEQPAADALLPLLERSERAPALVGLDFHDEVSWPICQSKLAGLIGEPAHAS